MFSLVEAVLTSALYDTLRPTQVSDLLLMTLVNPLPFARLMTIGLYPHTAAYRLSGHTAAASSVGWPIPSAWHGTALYSGRAGRHQCACGEGARCQAGDDRFGQHGSHGSSAEPSIVLENGLSFALVNRTRRLLQRQARSSQSGGRPRQRSAQDRFRSGKPSSRPDQRAGRRASPGNHWGCPRRRDPYRSRGLPELRRARPTAHRLERPMHSAE
jgi:hypothetical protein